MSFLTGFLIHLPAVAAGGLLVHQFLPSNQPARLLFKFGLGAGLGLGLTSLLYFLLLITTNSMSGYILIPLTLLIMSFYLTWRNRIQNPIFPEKFQFSVLQKYLFSTFGLLVLISLGSYGMHALMNSHGGFDAWMIYNRTARFFYRGQPDWLNAFSSNIYWQFHADYPLLVSLNLAGAWQTMGAENMRAAQAHGTYLMIGLMLMLMGSMAIARTTAQSILAGIVLLGTPVYIYEAPREATDLTLSFYILATIICLFLYHRERNSNYLILAGFASTLAAWTKNEGLLFSMISIAACVYLLYQDRELKFLPRYLIGLIPIFLVLYFKYFLAPSNDLFSSQADLLAHISDKERYFTIFKEFIDHLIWFGRGGISLLAVLLVYMLIVKWNPRPLNRPAYLACSFLLAIQFLGYFSIYVLTPHDLDWHLRTSLDRLIMHLYPAMLFLLFASLTDPETVFAE